MHQLQLGVLVLLMVLAFSIDPTERLKAIDGRIEALKGRLNEFDNALVDSAMRMELCDDIKLAISASTRRFEPDTYQSDHVLQKNTTVLQEIASKVIRSGDPARVVEFISSITDAQAEPLREILDNITDSLGTEYDQSVLESASLHSALIDITRERLNICIQLVEENSEIAKQLMVEIRKNRGEIASIQDAHDQYTSRFDVVAAIVNSLNFASRPTSPFSIEEPTRVDDVVDVVMAFVTDERYSNHEVRETLQKARNSGLLIDAFDILRHNMEHMIVRPLQSKLATIREKLEMIDQQTIVALSYRATATKEATDTQKSLTSIEGISYRL